MLNTQEQENKQITLMKGGAGRYYVVMCGTPIGYMTGSAEEIKDRLEIKYSLKIHINK